MAELGEFLLDYVIKERVQRVLFFFVTLSCLSKAVRYRPTGGATCLDFSQCGIKVSFVGALGPSKSRSSSKITARNEIG